MNRVEYSVTCAGTPVGTVTIATLAGLAHGAMRPSPAYDSIREHAARAGERLRPGRHFWNSMDGDFAEVFAQTWPAGRLALVDTLGHEAAVASVMLVEYAHPPYPGWHVVVDARPDASRSGAVPRNRQVDDSDRSRSAA